MRSQVQSQVLPGEKKDRKEENKNNKEKVLSLTIVTLEVSPLWG
jgi:hypothetical protein